MVLLQAENLKIAKGFGPYWLAQSEILFTNVLTLLHVCSKSLLKTLWEKEKLLVTSNVFFSNSVFFRLGELSAIFIQFKIVLCKLFQFERVQYFVLLERFNPLPDDKILDWSKLKQIAGNILKYI